jgi:hypothetical protein
MEAETEADLISQGFEDIREKLKAELRPSPAQVKKENDEAMAREMARMQAEYRAEGLDPPQTPWALSITARRQLKIGIVE